MPPSHQPLSARPSATAVAAPHTNIACPTSPVLPQPTNATHPPSHPQAQRASRRGRAYRAMLRSLTCGVGQGTHLFRCAVDFSLRAKGFSLSRPPSPAPQAYRDRVAAATALGGRGPLGVPGHGQGGPAERAPSLSYSSS